MRYILQTKILVEHAFFISLYQKLLITCIKLFTFLFFILTNIYKFSQKQQGFLSCFCTGFINFHYFLSLQSIQKKNTHIYYMIFSDDQHLEWAEEIQPAVSPFFAPFFSGNPTLTFNQGRKRVLLPPSGPLYFSSFTKLRLEEDGQGF